MGRALGIYVPSCSSLFVVSISPFFCCFPFTLVTALDFSRVRNRFFLDSEGNSSLSFRFCGVRMDIPKLCVVFVGETGGVDIRGGIGEK